MSRGFVFDGLKCDFCDLYNALPQILITNQPSNLRFNYTVIQEIDVISSHLI